MIETTLYFGLVPRRSPGHAQGRPPTSRATSVAVGPAKQIVLTDKYLPIPSPVAGHKSVRVRIDLGATISEDCKGVSS